MLAGLRGALSHALGASRAVASGAEPRSTSTPDRRLQLSGIGRFTERSVLQFTATYVDKRMIVSEWRNTFTMKTYLLVPPMCPIHARQTSHPYLLIVLLE